MPKTKQQLKAAKGPTTRRLSVGVTRKPIDRPAGERRERVRLRDIKSITRRKKAPRITAVIRREFEGFTQGEVIKERSVNSSWVSMIHLVMWAGKPALGVTFNNGVSVVYTTSGLREWEQMSGAPSKGKYIWRALYHGIPRAGAPYHLIVFS